MKPLNEYDLYNKPFSIERHKQVPFAEMEVMISPDGEISYAVPSHQEFLIRKAMDANGWSRDELMDTCPPKYYADFMQWLIDVSGGFIPVWEEGITHHTVTKQQAIALKKLKLAGLYHGALPSAEQIKP